jgi:hypothetical protein
MIFHILTGDCLAQKFPLDRVGGEMIVCREALVDGPVNAADEEGFWNARASFLTESSDQYQAYFQDVKAQFEKIELRSADDEIYLWFEHDLFCQVNYWFTIDRLARTPVTRVYRVSPLQRNERPWTGFADHDADDLAKCFADAAAFARGDFKLGSNLWECYRNEDVVGLTQMANSLSPCFPHLDAVCKAEAERKRNARPQKVLEEILSKGYTNFSDIFAQFSKREAIYGFGDVQVGQLLKNMRA